MDKYFKFLDDYCQYDYSHCARDHKSRAYTFKMLWDTFQLKQMHPVIIELGTTRSFVHGGHEGCMKFDTKYWFPDKPELWDWSAGCFTRVFAEIPDKEFHTVDISKDHIWVAETMTKMFGGMNYHVTDSCNFLNNLDRQVDLIYMDTGDMNPIDKTANLHLEEAKLIVKFELVKKGGYILMDDVRNPVPINEFEEKSCFGKDKLSIGYFLANGFDIVMDEYQMILKRMR
jgi:hypothetical protein